jgi:RNA polymerase sigma-70 factor (ECF subfamily)
VESSTVSVAASDELHALVSRIALGDEPALRDLYDASIARVYGLALRITGRREAAEEVAADVYMQVWREAAKYDAGRGRVLTWLLTICRSRAIDSLRRRDPAEPLPADDALDDAGSPPENDPADLLEMTVGNRRLHEALATLTPLQRQLLATAFFRGLTHEEVAVHCGMPLGSVKTHIRRAIAALRACLAQDTQESKR